MTPEEIEAVIPRDDRDDLIDEWALNPDNHPALSESVHVTLTISSLDQCQSLMDMAFDVLAAEKTQFVSDVRSARSTSALTAAEKVVAMRELLRQLIPLRRSSPTRPPAD